MAVSGRPLSFHYETQGVEVNDTPEEKLFQAEGSATKRGAFARTLDPVFRTPGERWQGPPLNGELIIMSGLTVSSRSADLLGY
jgi:hypothetical protein